jgi:hypothetical protein
MKPDALTRSLVHTSTGDAEIQRRVWLDPHELKLGSPRRLILVSFFCASLRAMEPFAVIKRKSVGKGEALMEGVITDDRLVVKGKETEGVHLEFYTGCLVLSIMNSSRMSWVLQAMFTISYSRSTAGLGLCRNSTQKTPFPTLPRPCHLQISFISCHGEFRVSLLRLLPQK